MSEVILALDVGDARIGVARGDADLAMAFGRGAIRRTGTPADVDEVARLAREEGAARVVVGLPADSRGGDSRQAERIRVFARALEAAGLEVVLEDERYTTRLAERQVRGSGLPQGKRRDKGRVDEASAVLILESHLQRLREGGPT